MTIETTTPIAPAAERPLPALPLGEPQAFTQAASRIAEELANVIKRQRLYVTIGGRRYVLHEGWTTLGAMVGVFPYVTECRPTPEGDGWWARVEARRPDGAALAAAEAECRRDEPQWRDRPSYALRSMAQTRASAKALRLCLGWIMALAGYEATPAEEMAAEAGPAAPAAPARPRGVARGHPQLEEGYRRQAVALAKRAFPGLDPYPIIALALNLPERSSEAIEAEWLARGGTWREAAAVMEKVMEDARKLAQQGMGDAEAFEEAARRLDAYGKLMAGEPAL